jgi:hypothetical protein
MQSVLLCGLCDSPITRSLPAAVAGQRHATYGCVTAVPYLCIESSSKMFSNAAGGGPHSRAWST